MILVRVVCCKDTATTEIYTYWHTLARPDALPISALNAVQAKCRRERRGGVEGMSMSSSGGCTGRRIPKGQGMGIGDWGLEKAEAVRLLFRIPNPQSRIPRPQGRKKSRQNAGPSAAILRRKCRKLS